MLQHDTCNPASGLGSAFFFRRFLFFPILTAASVAVRKDERDKQWHSGKTVQRHSPCGPGRLTWPWSRPLTFDTKTSLRAELYESTAAFQTANSHPLPLLATELQIFPHDTSTDNSLCKCVYIYEWMSACLTLCAWVPKPYVSKRAFVDGCVCDCR